MKKDDGAGMENRRLDEFKKLKEKGSKWKDWYATAEILKELNLTGQVDKINRVVNILENDMHINKNKKFHLVVWKIPSDHWDLLKEMVLFSLNHKEIQTYSILHEKFVNKQDVEARKYMTQAKIYENSNEFDNASDYYQKAKRIYLKINDNKKVAGLNTLIGKIRDLRDSYSNINKLQNEAEELFKLAEKYRKNNNFDDAINCYLQAQSNYKLMNENRTVQDLEILIKEIQEQKRKRQDRDGHLDLYGNEKTS